MLYKRIRCSFSCCVIYSADKQRIIFDSFSTSQFAPARLDVFTKFENQEKGARATFIEP